MAGLLRSVFTLEIVSSKLHDLADNVSVVSGFVSREERLSPRTFAGRVGFRGIFNALLPSLTPTGVWLRSGDKALRESWRLLTSVEVAGTSMPTFDANRIKMALMRSGQVTGAPNCVAGSTT